MTKPTVRIPGAGRSGCAGSRRESLGATEDADVLEGSWELARSVARNSLVLSVEAGSALDDRVNSPQDLFTLGGFLELSGLPRDALTGTQYGLARAIMYRRVSRGGTGLFEYPAYLGFSIEAGNVWQTRDDVDAGDLVWPATSSSAPTARWGRSTWRRAG